MGIYYINVGEGESRSWLDMKNYNFISAGNGSKYSKPLKSLIEGDIVCMYYKGAGYVGIGKVTKEAVPVMDFKTNDGNSLSDEILSQANITHDASDYELCEWLVGIEWLTAVDTKEAKWRAGTVNGIKIFTTPLIKASMQNQQPTIDFLSEKFGIDIRALAGEEDNKESVEVTEEEDQINKLFAIGFGITPSSPNEENGDIDDDTFNLGEHISSDIIMIEDKKGNILIIHDNGAETFDNEYEANQFITGIASKVDAFESFDEDIISILYDTMLNQEVDEEDEEFIEDELGCTLEVEQDFLETNSEHGNCLYAYMLVDSYNASVEIVDNELFINNEKVEISDILGHDLRNNDEDIITVITSASIIDND